MENYFHIQALLLKWHKHHGLCSIEQIRNASTNLLYSFNFETSYPLFKVFFPLVRKGFVEFCGDGNYQITKPTLLYYKKEQVSVGLNLLNEQKRIIETQFELINIDDFEVIRFKSDLNKVMLFSKISNCEFSEPNIPEILSNFPKISDIVEKFERASITSSGEFYEVKKHRWKKNKNQTTGVFRISDDAQKYYIRTKLEDLQIPDYRINPDARPISECYQAAIENLDFLYYDKENNELTVKDINIPILIDRVLRMASLQNVLGVHEENGKTIYENISLSAVKQLSRIFETHVKIEA